MNIRTTDRFVRNPDLVTRKIAGETLLVPVTGKLADLADLFSLNGTGAHIWQQLSEEVSTQDICVSLVNTFSVDPNEAWRDLAELLEALLAAELITPRPAPATGDS